MGLEPQGEAMSLARLLADLQEADQALTQARQALAQVERALEDRSALERARQEERLARGEVERLRRLQRELEEALADLDRRQREVEERLYRGGTTSTRELVGLQQETEQLARQRSQVEDRLLEVMDALESAQARLAEARRRREEAEAEWEAERARLEGDRAGLQGRVVQWEARRSALADQVPAEVLALYERLRQSRGYAVARVAQGICRACGIALTTQVLQQVRQGREVVRCPNCGRILVSE